MSSSSAAARSGRPPATRASRIAKADEKILKDLEVLKQNMDNFQSMITSAGDNLSFEPGNANEALLAVIGFLEACEPRMVTLVQLAAQGALSEPVLIECLDCNDRLQKLLEEVDVKATVEESRMATSTAAAAPAKTGLEQDIDSLLLGDDEDDDEGAANSKPVATKTTGEDEDEFVNAKPAAAPTDLFAAKPEATEEISQTKSQDDFDDFFASRTGASDAF